MDVAWISLPMSRSAELETGVSFASMADSKCKLPTKKEMVIVIKKHSLQTVDDPFRNETRTTTRAYAHLENDLFTQFININDADISNDVNTESFDFSCNGFSGHHEFYHNIYFDCYDDDYINSLGENNVNKRDEYCNNSNDDNDYNSGYNPGYSSCDKNCNKSCDVYFNNCDDDDHHSDEDYTICDKGYIDEPEEDVHYHLRAGDYYTIIDEYYEGLEDCHNGIHDAYCEFHIEDIDEQFKEYMEYCENKVWEEVTFSQQEDDDSIASRESEENYSDTDIDDDYCYNDEGIYIPWYKTSWY
ncbi:hypothetical protein DPMN_147880 [Dreissena polymorpha]|uniref:Uncharacterized protein n=1 Tax=Dreissena polymorpha TaxID=45954 RepID=A0A9D4F911_DREPO|nr:hypothetical protein DPMN_147880 [Dreissena polymorpha]